jgi:hypothetical protein
MICLVPNEQLSSQDENKRSLPPKKKNKKTQKTKRTKNPISRQENNGTKLLSIKSIQTVSHLILED